MDKNEIQSFYTYIQSQQTAYNFLNKCYKDFPEIDCETKSYENCNSFLYYLNHGLYFYKTGKKLDVSLQPILYFYGMVHLLKANLLTKRPNYPESTKLLAHGVSSRKRKKKDYIFLNDEVKVQKHGLFSYFANHLFGIKNISFEKITMKRLLALIPEMNLLFKYNKEQKLIEIGELNGKSIRFPIQILDYYYLTENAFIKRVSPFIYNIENTIVDQNFIHINLSTPFAPSQGPFFLNNENNKLYFPIHRENFLITSEVMIHYLLLYNLSIISRYETEWWGDLITHKAETDYPFIIEFLQTTAEKTPLLLGNLLLESYLEKEAGTKEF